MRRQSKKPFTRRISFEQYAGTSISPVVFDAPHSGLIVPDHMLYECATENLRSLEDPYVPLLFDDAYKHDMTLFINNIHRSVIDMNRDPDEINPADVRDGWNRPHRITPYTQAGHGVIPVRLGGPHRLTEIYNDRSRPSSYEIDRRLSWYYKPYHSLLNRILEHTHRHNGYYIHVDLHSMNRKAPFKPNRPDICIGTLDDRTSHPILDHVTKRFFLREGLSIEFNKPFKGTTIINNTHDPQNARYSIQLEIARDLYMQPDSYKMNYTKFKKLRDTMSRFTAELDQLTKTHGKVLRAGYANTPSQAPASASSSRPKSP